MVTKVKSGKVLKRTVKAINDGAHVVIHKGGTGSGKTYDLMIYIILIALNTKDQIITVVSESKPHLDIGAIRIAQKIINDCGFAEQVKFNISKGFYTFPSGSIIEFFSADRIDKALGARRDWLYGNEINSLKLDVWEELARRSEYVLGDFNPTSQFWLESWIGNYDDVVIVKSNYLDNIYLPDTERKRIEKRASRDANFRRIHIDCEYGIYEGLVFDSWLQCEAMPDGPTRYGMDFGYTNDPTVLVRVVDMDDAWYIDEMIYQTGMLNRDIVSRLSSLGIRKHYDEIIADSAEPKSIDEIRLAGYNVKPAPKGPDSIMAGIDRLKGRKMYVTQRSVNIIKELRNYSWVSDKNGRPTNKPIDGFNHAIDAMRYAVGFSKRRSDINKLEGIFY